MDGAGAGESSVSRTPIQVVDDAETTAVLSEKPIDGADAGAGGSSVPQISIEAVNDENRVDDDNKDPESELLLSADNNTEVLVDTSKEPKEEDHFLPRKGRDNDDDDDDDERNYHSIKRGVNSWPELNVLGKPVRKTD
ncbi:hypothetical protein DPMN_107663 [Dreissena polymorpha]|uniref:Uncharacterized protein n=2 Tax=Dreissena polymorpha TaxID=45954 RepID=A0A9D4K7D2_DREPO|nr:hypothetical protein DPMN_107663 [Dreissena polymorpha]